MVSQISPLESQDRVGFNDGRETKIVLGVDTDDMYMWAVDLVANLALNHPVVTLLHATSKECPIEDASPGTEQEYGKFLEDLGIQALRQSQRYASSKNLEVKTQLEFGRAADIMMREATAADSDLIALCAIRHGDWSKAYMGSATCALALYSDRSLLVAKTLPNRERKMKAVLAVDHSKASDRMIEKFLKLSPNGIAEIMVLSAYGLEEEAVREMDEKLPSFGERYNVLLRESVERKNRHVVDRLLESGYRATSSAVRASPNKAILDAVQSFGADILVIGATGEGSVSNSKIGSIALHQISTENHSILMLRD